MFAAVPRGFIIWVGVILLSGSLMSSIAVAYPSYYDISEHDKAQVEARQRNLPLAWLGSFPDALNNGNPVSGSTADLTQMAMTTLKDQAVIIFFDGRDMTPVPPMIHAQFHIHDDTELKDGVDWMSPKVVFTNPEVTSILGRVSFTQMRTDREAAINSALQVIKNNPDAMAPPPPIPTPDQASTTASASSNGGKLMDTVSDGFQVVEWVSDNIIYIAVGAVLILGGLFFFLSRAKRQ